MIIQSTRKANPMEITMFGIFKRKARSCSSIRIFGILAWLLLPVVLFAQSAQVKVGTVSGNPGATVALPVSLTQGATTVTALQFDLTLASGLSYVSVAATQASTSAGKTVSGSVVAGKVRVLIYGGTNAVPSSFVNVNLNIASLASPGTLAVGITGILASDINANSVAVTGSGGSVTVTSPTDVTPPTISGVVSSAVTQNSATINWTTDEVSDSQVEYGTTTSYGSSTVLNTGLVTTHSQSLTGLTAGITYHYRVKSKDAAGNPAVSGDFTFTTTAPPLPAPTNVRVL